MSMRDTSEPIEELTETLWFERRLLEFLLFKLVSANLVLTTGDTRFVGPSIAEVERVLEKVRVAEKVREAALGRFAESVGMHPSELTFKALIDVVPPTYRSEFNHHRHEFAAMTAEIERLAQSNRQLAVAGVSDIQRAFGVEASDTYTAEGHHGTATMAPPRLELDL